MRIYQNVNGLEIKIQIANDDLTLWNIPGEILSMGDFMSVVFELGCSLLLF